MSRRNTAIALALTLLAVLLLSWSNNIRHSLDPGAVSDPKAVANVSTGDDELRDEPKTSSDSAIEEAEPEEIATTPDIDYTTGGTIQGSVSDAWTGHPIQDFDLLVKRGQYLNFNLRKHRGFRAHHDPLGLFFLNDLPAEGLTVFVRAEGYEPDLRYLPGVRPEIAVADVDFMLHPHASLNVIVVDQFGQPVDGADVVLAEWEQAQWSGYPEAPTNKQGIAQFSKLRPGPTPVTVFMGTTFVESHARVTIEKENVVRVVFVGEEPLQGRVYYDGQPRPGVRLTLNAAGRTPTVTTDSEGHFAFQYVPNLSGRLTIQIPEYPHVEFLMPEIDTRRDNEPIRIDIPAFETGFRLDVDIELAEDEEAGLDLSGRLPGPLFFRHSFNIRKGTTYELTPIPLWDYSISVHIAKETETELPMITTGRLDTTNMLQSGKLLIGTIHVERPRSILLLLSLTGDYVPL